MLLKEPFVCPMCQTVWKHHNYCVKCENAARTPVPPEQNPNLIAIGNGAYIKRTTDELAVNK